MRCTSVLCEGALFTLVAGCNQGFIDFGRHFMEQARTGLPLGMVDDELQHRGNLQRQLHGLAKAQQMPGCPVTHGALIAAARIAGFAFMHQFLDGFMRFGCKSGLRHILYLQAVGIKSHGSREGRGLA
jgi:hypothetical protein